MKRFGLFRYSQWVKHTRLGIERIRNKITTLPFPSYFSGHFRRFYHVWCGFVGFSSFPVFAIRQNSRQLEFWEFISFVCAGVGGGNVFSCLVLTYFRDWQIPRFRGLSGYAELNVCVCACVTVCCIARGVGCPKKSCLAVWWKNIQFACELRWIKMINIKQHWST